MNSRQLSLTMKYNNNYFIIASRAYFQQSAPPRQANTVTPAPPWRLAAAEALHHTLAVATDQAPRAQQYPDIA